MKNRISIGFVVLALVVITSYILLYIFNKNQSLLEGQEIIRYIEKFAQKNDRLPEKISFDTQYNWHYEANENGIYLRCYYFYFRDSWVYSRDEKKFILDREH